MVEASQEDAILRTDIYDRVPGERWFNGRVVLAGDAIHPCAPFVGQGAGIAIEDGVVLAKELSLTNGLEDLGMIRQALEAYQARRAPRTRQLVMEGRKRGRLCSIENGALCAVRNTAMSLVPSRVWRRQLRQFLIYDI